MLAVGKQMLDLGTTLELGRKKAETVFGSDALGDVKDWANESAAAMGVTKNAAIGLATNFADLLIPMGFSRMEAARMSTDVVGLSGALAEWSGGTKTAAEVSDILAKAMLGEREGLKSLGISITEADIDARLLANGQQELTGAQLEQAKATATQQLIFEKSKDAQTAFKEGGDTLARTQSELKARFGEVKEQVATALIPVFHNIFGFITEKAIPAVQNLFQWIGDKLKPVFDAVRKAIEDNRPQLEKLAEFLGKVVNIIREYVLPIVGKLIGTGFKVLGEVLSGIIRTIGFLVDVFTNIVEVVKTVVEWIGKLIDKLKGIKLPGFLTPGSPSPFENALWGIRDATKAVVKEMPNKLGFDVATSTLNGSVAGASVGLGTTINVNLSGPVYATGGERQLAEHLADDIQGALLRKKLRGGVLGLA